MKVHAITAFVTLVLIGAGIAVLGYLIPLVVKYPVEEQHSDVILEGKDYKVNARDVKWKSFSLLETKTIYINMTSDNRLTGFYLVRSYWFDFWERNDFHGTPRNTIIKAYDVNAYSTEVKLEAEEYVLVFDNGGGTSKAYVNYFVESRWVTTEIGQVQGLHQWAWVGIAMVLVGSIGLVAYRNRDLARDGSSQSRIWTRVRLRDSSN